MYLLEVGDNKKGVQLKQTELELLKKLLHHRLLTTSQLYSLYSSYVDVSYISFCNRLKKLYSMDIINKKEYTLGQKGFYFNYFRIGKRGVDALVANEFIEHDAADEYEDVKKGFNAKNIDHYLAIQELVVDVLKCGEQKREQFQSIHPWKVPYIDKHSKEDEKLVIPDWIIKKGNKYLNIEMDTGSESLSTLKEKVKRYMNLAEQKPNQKHVVLFVLLDESFTTRQKYGDRTVRVGNVKQSLINTKGIEGSNLDVYVVSLSNASNIAYQLLIGETPLDMGSRRMEVDIAVQTLEQLNSVFDYQFDALDAGKIYIDAPSELHADGAYALKNPSGYTVDTVLLVYMCNGDVKSLNRLDYLYRSLENNRFGINISRIIAIYKDEHSLKSDVIGRKYNHVILGDNATWGENLDEQPIFYSQVSPVRKERGLYDKFMGSV